MRRAFAAFSAALAGLAVAGPAAAKELTQVKVCGLRDECATITDARRLSLVPTGGATSVAAPPVGPFHVMHLTIEHGDDAEVGSVYYLRDADLLAANAVDRGLVWLPIADPRSRELMRDLTRGIEPYPAPPAWPQFGLKSSYRVIPDDEVLPAHPPAALERSAPSGSEENAVAWVAAAIALVLGLAAAALLLGRLAAHQPRDQLAEAIALEHAADTLRDR